MMALKALGQIVSTTGCVISPYLSHPELLDGLINIIQSPNTHNFELRCEATRAFGILGVADPLCPVGQVVYLGTLQPRKREGHVRIRHGCV